MVPLVVFSSFAPIEWLSATGATGWVTIEFWDGDLDKNPQNLFWQAKDLTRPGTEYVKLMRPTNEHERRRGQRATGGNMDRQVVLFRMIVLSFHEGIV